jgi:hypothetical protein
MSIQPVAQNYLLTKLHINQLPKNKFEYKYELCIRKNFEFCRDVATDVYNERLLHAVVFSEKLRWFEPTNVIILKTHHHAVNAR